MRDGDIEIYLMDADGSNERRLTNGIGASMQPGVFARFGGCWRLFRTAAIRFQIYLMHLDRPLTKRDLLLHLE